MMYRFFATAIPASMWFFVSLAFIHAWDFEMETDLLAQLLYRARKDGPVLLGWRHPWEH